MNYGEYHHSVSSFDRENFEKIIRDSRRFPEVLWERGRNKIVYEYRDKEYYVKSKIRAVQSRNEFQNLSVQDEILLRFYGRFALILNRIMRNTRTIYINTLLKSDDQKIGAQNNTKIFMEHNQIKSYKDISVVDGFKIYNRLLMEDHIPAICLINTIDQLIAKHRSEHVDTDYFYRISRTKKNVYATEDEFNKLSLDIDSTVKLGGIVIDKAITSVGNDLQSILFRYSAKGQSATHNNNPVKVYEEEILYVIKNNEKLDYMDIAGFKFDRAEINSDGRFASDSYNQKLIGEDEFSSGEIIIPSHTPFRIIGIQKMESNMNRKIVFLDPIKFSDINRTDIVRNNFDGELIAINGGFDLSRLVD